MTHPCTRNALHERIGWTCPDCGHHGLAHPGVNPGLAHCALCELDLTRQAAADQEAWLADEAQQLDHLLTELRAELTAIKKLRATYENDIHEMQPIRNAIHTGAAINIEYPHHEYPTLNTDHRPWAYGIHP